MHESVRNVIEVTLAEYATMTAEIRGRSEAQASLMNIAAVASVGLAGYSLQAEGAGRQVVLLLPFVGAVFGLLWLDHHRAITKLGRFVREHSRSEILAAVSLLDEVPDDLSRRLLRWEWACQDLATSSRREISTNFVTPQAVVFALPGLVGLGFGTYLAVGSAYESDGIWPLVWQFGLLILGALLILFLLVQWRDAFKPERSYDLFSPNHREFEFLECHPNRPGATSVSPASETGWRSDQGDPSSTE